MAAEMVKLVCKDGEVVEVERSIAEQSTLVKGLIDDGDIEEEIPLANTKKATLDKVIVFCQYIKDNAPPQIDKPLRSTELSDVTTPWYTDFVNGLEQEELFELILASNYLDIKTLLELTCAKVATMIKNKTIPEIRKFFSIENDFTPEEEAQIMEENKWAEESF
jgi:S-phase kinase-associated protein 1